MSKIVRVSEVMTAEVLKIEGVDTVSDAAAKMRSNNVSELLVAKRSPDDAWGIITIQDLVQGVIAPGRNPKDVFVYEVMSKPVVTVPADMDIRYAIRLLQRVGVHCAPVEDRGDIVGMLTIRNLVLGSDALWQDSP